MKNLILALIVSFGLTACSNGGTRKSEPAAAVSQLAQEQPDRIEVLYFHGKQRCATCMAIEKHAREVVETQFADELKSGKVVFKSIDISDPANESVAGKYEITWSSLIISGWKGGKETFENMTEYAFANARTAPDAFKGEIAGKIKSLSD